MSNRVADMTIDELRVLISQSVQESLEDALEDMAALASPGYVGSIENARRQYERGEVTPIADLEDA